MAAATELATIAGIRAACQALALSRASYYRKLHPGSSPSPISRRPPARALRPEERQTVLACLHEERFQDRSPAAVYATLLDEGTYHCSIRKGITWAEANALRQHLNAVINGDTRSATEVREAVEGRAARASVGRPERSFLV